MVTALMKKSLHSKEQVELQELLKRVRDNAGLTQAKLAAELGKPQSFVAKYEAGERRLDVIELIHVLETLGEQPADFIARLVKAMKKSA